SRREARRDPVLAGAALWELDQLQADRGAGGLAALAGAACFAGSRRIADPQAHPDEDAQLMGWAILLLLLALGLGGLWLLGVRGGLLKAAGAALLVGASGYALQGHPDMPGAPAHSSEAANVLPLTEARHAFFGRFTP